MLRELAISWKSKDIQVENLVDKDLAIFADSQLSTEVFRNLLTNSIKFTPQNGIIKIESEEINGSKMLHFTDTGIGISKELLPKIFQMNVSRTGTNGEKGFGIGLQRSLEMMELQSGTILVTSKEKEGSRFSVCFR
ncbi:MAG: sensor histidine kinase [Leptospira sp.]|nr:sensor histidine kinase [Leptospira sp.]